MSNGFSVHPSLCCHECGTPGVGIGRFWTPIHGHLWARMKCPKCRFVYRTVDGKDKTGVRRWSVFQREHDRKPGGEARVGAWLEATAIAVGATRSGRW